MKTSVVIYADEGKVLTNGEIYGKQIFLAEGEMVSDYHEITQERYAEILSQRAEEEKDVY